MIEDFVDTLVIGAGQSGIAASEHLKNAHIPHLVLEKDRIAEKWRTGRWDSLVANGPAWHDRFPSLEFEGFDNEDFVPKESVADYFVKYKEKFNLPIETNVEVKKVIKQNNKSGFLVETSKGQIQALRIIVATGPFQNAIIPKIVPKVESLTQIHSANYKNPAQLPEGKILVIGAGSSGTQIALELRKNGREVYLSVGAHGRPPRRYRGFDYCYWYGVLGLWDDTEVKKGYEHITISVSGAYGGETIDFRQLAKQGIILVGSTLSFDDNKVKFRDDLSFNIEQGDNHYLEFLDSCDKYIKRNGLNFKEEAEARIFSPNPDCIKNPILELNLEKENIKTIIWATGYKNDYSWLNVDTFNKNGQPIHSRGVSKESGIYFLGLPFLSRRGSSFIWGVWRDAKYIVDHIEIQRAYLDYQNSH